jgi:hypothetical protein
MRALTAMLGMMFAGPALATPVVTSFDSRATLRAADELCAQVKMPADTKLTVMNRLTAALQDPGLKAKIGAAPVAAVFAYQMGEGGFIMKKKTGAGALRFADGKERRIVLSGTTWGAQIGGASTWGVALVLGLKDTDHFAVKYEGGEVNATAGDAAVALDSMDAADDAVFPQELVFVSTATGLSAGAAGGWLNISYAD